MNKFALLLVLPLLMGCSRQISYSRLGAEPAIPLPYAEAVKLWQRHGEFNRKWVTALSVDAVLESWDYRRARVTTRARNLKWSGLETTNAILKEQADFNAGITFFCAVYTNDKDWNTWDEPGKQWSFLLVNDAGATVKAVSSEATKLDAADRFKYFPAIQPWHKLYRVRFPWVNANGAPLWTPETRLLEFHITGTLGELVVDWKLTPTQAGMPTLP